MEIDNAFDVPLPIAETWAVLTDIERIAPCMPGAELTEVVDATNYKGTVAVRLGPVALTFNGRARFEDMDETGYRARVKAWGSDTKGRGGVEAYVTFSLEPDGDGTRVSIHTDLTLTGSVAQYGRGAGMISDLATHLIAQFAECLRTHLADRGTEAAPAPGPAKPVPVLGLGLRVLWSAVVRTFKRLFR